MLELASLFCDHAVMQRGISIPVWGWTEKNSVIHAEFNGKTAFSMASSHGNFMIRFPAMNTGGPYELTVKNVSTGEKIVLHDILIGEVWICSGQSNMEYLLGSVWATVNSSASMREARDAGIAPENQHQLDEFRETHFDTTKFRFFNVRRDASAAVEATCVPASACMYGDAQADANRWFYMDQEHLANTTAVGAWFGLTLLQNLNVPVGIINSSWGGTIIETWTSRPALLANPATHDMTLKADEMYADASVWNRTAEDFDHQLFLQRHSTPDRGNQGIDWGWAAPDFNDSSWSTMPFPGNWTEEKIGLNGAVWMRRHVNLPDSWNGKPMTLHFGGADKHDITYFNGTEIGRTGSGIEVEYWATPRAYSIPAGLAKSGDNLIAMRIYSFIFQGGTTGNPCDYYLQLDETGEKINIAGTCLAAVEYEIGDFINLNFFFFTNLKYGRGQANTPHILFDSMIASIAPFAVKGAVWYQGESNTTDRNDTDSYASKLVSMMNSWRDAWELPEMPLIQIQLARYMTPANYEPDALWPYLRDQQLQATKLDKNIHLVSIMDTGESDDIHPEDKKTPGIRLAMCALNKIYGINTVTPYGPVFQTARRENNAIRITFDAADGLALRGNPAESFFIAGTDGAFTPADSVTIENDTLLIAAASVPCPVNVRYAWSDFPTVTLFNAAGLPAAAFETGIIQ